MTPARWRVVSAALWLVAVSAVIVTAACIVVWGALRAAGVSISIAVLATYGGAVTLGKAGV